MLEKSLPQAGAHVPNDLAAFWMPFTSNRAFKQAPRMLAGAKDMHCFTTNGRKILDGAAGMWCSNAGHGRRDEGSPPCRRPVLEYGPHPVGRPRQTAGPTYNPGHIHPSADSRSAPCHFGYG